MGGGSLRVASPLWVHALVLWTPESADPAQFLELIDLPQLDAGTARTLFWYAPSADENVTRYDLNRATAARIAGFSAPWFEIFDRLGRRAATTGFATARISEPALSTSPMGGTSPAEWRAAIIEALNSYQALGRMDWVLAKSLIVNSGDPFDPALLTPEERASLPPQPYGYGGYGG